MPAALNLGSTEERTVSSRNVKVSAVVESHAQHKGATMLLRIRLTVKQESHMTPIPDVTWLKECWYSELVQLVKDFQEAERDGVGGLDGIVITVGLPRVYKREILFSLGEAKVEQRIRDVNRLLAELMSAGARWHDLVRSFFGLMVSSCGDCPVEIARMLLDEKKARIRKGCLEAFSGLPSPRAVVAPSSRPASVRPSAPMVWEDQLALDLDRLLERAMLQRSLLKPNILSLEAH